MNNLPSRHSPCHRGEKLRRLYPTILRTRSVLEISSTNSLNTEFRCTLPIWDESFIPHGRREFRFRERTCKFAITIYVFSIHAPKRWQRIFFSRQRVILLEILPRELLLLFFFLFQRTITRKNNFGTDYLANTLQLHFRTRQSGYEERVDAEILKIRKQRSVVPGLVSF